MLLAPRDQTHFTRQVRWALRVVAVLAVFGGLHGAVWAVRGSAPRGGSGLGLAYGVVAAGVVGFELLLWPRKRFRFRGWAARTRQLAATERWMAAHVWLGLAVGPLAVLHSGWRLGGPLPTALMACLVAVVLSGVYGLYLQAVIPRRLMREVPDEVPAVEAERMLKVHTAEAADRLGYAVATVLRARFADRFQPFLAGKRDTELACPRRAAALFADLREAAPADGPLVDDLARLCDLRRQFDTQARLLGRLHGWVPVHLVLSVVLFGLLVAHVVTAVRYI